MIALKLYRTLPQGMRRRLIAVLPQHRRLSLVRTLTRPSGGDTVRVIGSRVTVSDGGARTEAEVVAAATPLQMWHRNLTAVTTALAAAGIDHHCLRNDDYLRSSVAVLEDRRAEVLRLVRSAPALSGAHVRVVEVRPGRNQPDLTPTEVIQVWFPVTDVRAGVVLGVQFACEIEFWTRVGDVVRAPRHNAVVDEAPAWAEPVRVAAALISHFVPEADDRTYRTRRDLTVRAPDRVGFPIDAVFTWVDGSDPEWLRRKEAALGTPGGLLHAVAANTSRYHNRDELRYAMRSLHSFAPWLRRIFLVTDSQLPSWLDPNHPMVTVVTHAELFADLGGRSSFNSHAIESRLHRIEGLAEHFLYFNDDVFLGRPLLPTHFFHANGIAKFFLSPAQFGLGEAKPSDPPVNAAGKNNRWHIQRQFGVTITQKMKHTPFALRRSIMYQIEQVLQSDVMATARHQFRHHGDLSIPSSLYQYWAYLTGQAVPGDIEYEYADLGHPSTPARLAELLARRHRDVFCLNDTDSDPEVFTEQESMLADFLPRYLPFPAPFELPDHVVAERRKLGATALWRQARSGDRHGRQVDAATTPSLRVGRQVDAATAARVRVSPRLDAPTLPSVRIAAARAVDHDKAAPPGAGPSTALGEARDA
ncbi:Stealth protein CR1, conserved region 1 [Micromonospora rhizosphaerae]|uniref:Stealth protein CR1, conserved region 1 n=1 Tax=Micromonospora rhizosphaerae TaxID=568872 RepID=A0A1C6RZB5_9ACTN|nr:stealth family protein [Micromonospora rhizosphaerae]SCL22366.1 Stealth protein CR1, conserved region 1 [Micromonospora rhizosphaerae]